MNKNWLIIQREYLSRVRKKSFIILTLLIPLIIVGFIALEVFFISGGTKDNKSIAVIDESGLFEQALQKTEDLQFTFLVGTPIQKEKDTYQKEGFDGLLYIPKIDIQNPSGFTYYSEHQLGLNSYLYLTGQINDIIKNKRMVLAGIDKKKLNQMEANISLAQVTSSSKSKGHAQYITFASSAIGYISGFLIYFALILFGTMVLRGVAEEKTNRISEIMISSVKPTQLMTGKIVGIGAVGLTQFIIWIILALIGIYFFGNFSQQLMSSMSPMGGGQDSGQLLIILQQLKGIIAALPVVEIVLCFLFYFFGGYLLYAALFAAVGSAVDQEMTESQSLTLPITMPIIISFFIMFSAIQNPDSTLAVVCSIFPLSSPIVMMARIPYGIPAWQLILSILLLIATIWLTIRIAGKIYRTGILLYGKKVTIKEMTKWIFRK